MKYTLFLLLFSLIVAGCAQAPTATPIATKTQERNVLGDLAPSATTPAATPSRTPTATARSSATPTFTPEPPAAASVAQMTTTPQFVNPTGTPTPPTPTADPATYGLGDEYQIVVSYTFEPEAGNDAEETRILVVVASVTNQSSTSLTVRGGSLAVAASDGRLYAPDTDAGGHSPALIGAEIMPGESFLGLIPFTLPAGVKAEQITWCPQTTTCTEPLRAPIP